MVNVSGPAGSEPSPGEMGSQERTLLIQSLWKPMGSAWDLVANPPPTYRFLVREGATERAARWATRSQLPYAFIYLTRPFLPISLIKDAWNSLGDLPPGVDLVYAMSCLWFGKSPWVLDMQSELAHALVGDVRLFRIYRPLIRAVLRSPWCRGIIYGLESGKQGLLQLLGGDKLVEQKTEVIPWAVSPKPHLPRLDDGKVRLLFVASANVKDLSNFDLKGGKETVAAFQNLRTTHPNLELVVRCPLTNQQRRQLRSMEGVHVYEDALPWDRFEELWRTSDIFVQPGHATHSVASLDAMSFGLPVVMTDVPGGNEMVRDGETGFLVPKLRTRRYTDDQVVLYHSREHKRDRHNVDQGVVSGLVGRLGQLIENPELRQRMGEAGRREVAEGRHSFKQRNLAMKEFLDKAMVSSYSGN